MCSCLYKWHLLSNKLCRWVMDVVSSRAPLLERRECNCDVRRREKAGPFIWGMTHRSPCLPLGSVQCALLEEKDLSWAKRAFSTNRFPESLSILSTECYSIVSSPLPAGACAKRLRALRSRLIQCWVLCSAPTDERKEFYSGVGRWQRCRFCFDRGTPLLKALFVTIAN